MLLICWQVATCPWALSLAKTALPFDKGEDFIIDLVNPIPTHASYLSASEHMSRTAF
jgi:hypothetical protein